MAYTSHDANAAARGMYTGCIFSLRKIGIILRLV